MSNIDDLEKIANDMRVKFANCDNQGHEFREELDRIAKDNPSIFPDIMKSLASSIYTNPAISKNPIVYDDAGRVVGFKKELPDLLNLGPYDVVKDPTLSGLAEQIVKHAIQSCRSR